jgi:hypothetical protein
MHRPPINPQKDPLYLFLLDKFQGHSAAVRIMSIEKSSNLIGNRNRDLSACSIVSQLITLPRALVDINE